MALRKPAVARFEERRRLGDATSPLQVHAQAARVPGIVRLSLREVAEEHLGLGVPLHALEQVGQLVSRAGPEQRKPP